MISVILGVIGVGGLVFQWASGIIDEFFQTLEDLKDRVTALEMSSSGSSTSACTCDLTAVTATANAACAKVNLDEYR